MPTDVWLGVSAYLVAQDVAALSHLDRRMKEHQLYKYRWMDTLERRLGIEDETFETVRNWYPVHAPAMMWKDLLHVLTPCYGRARTRRYPRYSLARTRPRAHSRMLRACMDAVDREEVMLQWILSYTEWYGGGGERVSRKVSACNRTFIQNHYLQTRCPYANALVDADA